MEKITPEERLKAQQAIVDVSMECIDKLVMSGVNPFEATNIILKEIASHTNKPTDASKAFFKYDEIPAILLIMKIKYGLDL